MPADRAGKGRPVLVTGFEPFDRQTSNASWAAVELLAASWMGPPELVTVRLPVSFRGARQALRTAVAEHAPGMVICVGEAGGRSAVGLERVAVNLIDARIPDNDGSAPVDLPVVAGAPAALFSTLPVKACLVAVADVGVPAEVSLSAGTYVCNATFYALMHLLERTPDVRGGLVHVPRTPEQAPDGPSLPAADVARALEVIVRTAASTGPDVRVSAGGEN
jgi:pyroglutamyl-peptidase